MNYDFMISNKYSKYSETLINSIKIYLVNKRNILSIEYDKQNMLKSERLPNFLQLSQSVIAIIVVN